MWEETKVPRKNSPVLFGGVRDHLTRVSNLGHSGEKGARYHCTSQTAIVHVWYPGNHFCTLSLTHNAMLLTVFEFNSCQQRM